MSVNLVLLVKDRPRLTAQCLETLYANTPLDQFNLLAVDDGSQWTGEVRPLDQLAVRNYDNCRIITLQQSIGIVGWLRNVGASASERFFGRGDYLCFIDNDIAFRENWLRKMMFVMENHYPVILGGYRHPFHGVNKELNGWQSTDAVAGYMHFMKWSTWDDWGPYDDHAKGVCQSEDFKMCQDIIKKGGEVGYIHPPVILNCGITNSEGKPAIGSDSFLRLTGYLYE